MTIKRLILLASLPLMIAVALGVLAMLPPGPGVTKANFDRIEKGMTTAQVKEIFGGTHVVILTPEGVFVLDLDQAKSPRFGEARN